MAMTSELAARLFRDDYRVASANKVEHMLRRIAEQREPLRVIAPGSSEEFTSMLLHVDRAANSLVIDELNPDRGNALLESGAPLHALGRCDGVWAGFVSRKLEALQWEGYGALRIAYPDALHHLQRRSFFRVLVSASDVGEVELQRRGARPLFGQCHDLSATGMRVQFRAPTDYTLSEGELLPVVRFRLTGFELTAEAQVRFVSAARSSRLRDAPRTLGLRFLNMHAAFEQRILAYVQRRDRELLRDSGRMFE